MAFTKSLYYPWIDIRDEAWIKNAALYWNEIQTIVPSSIEAPYSLDSARLFKMQVFFRRCTSIQICGILMSFYQTLYAT